MTTPVSNMIRVLSIDPTSRGFGFAVFEGSDYLIDWGVVQARTDKNRKCLDRIVKLIERYRPRTIIIEETTRGSRRGQRVRQLLCSVEEYAGSIRIKVRRVLQQQVRQMYCETGAPTKHRIAKVIVERFPELGPHLPPPRKPWNSEAEVMAVFDAVAFALTLFTAPTKLVHRHLRAPKLPES
jgi:Holliday junction resolvasome RuvABC endonuclease subunit